MTIFGNFLLGSTTGGAAVGEGFAGTGFTATGFEGVALGLIRGIGVAAEGVAVAGGVGGVTGRVSPPFGTEGRAGVEAVRKGVTCGGGTPRPLVGVAVG